MALTEQKRLYAMARLSGVGKKQAAIVAGCPAKTASQAASRYEKDPDVKDAIARKLIVEAVEKKEEPPPVERPVFIAKPADDPLTFMRQVMCDLEADPKLRLEAAKALASFTVAKPGEKGKKDQQKEDAEAVIKNRFAPSGKPRLVVSNG